MAALLLIACTAPGHPGATASPDPGAGSASAVSGATGRILVLTHDGGIFTIAPDGSDRVLIQAAGAGTLATDPTWAPDGARVAWVEVRNDGGIPRSSIITARADGSDHAEAGLQTTPFFLEWDPTSTRVAYLAPNDATGLSLGVVDVGADPQRAHVLTGGAPLYFDWQPDGRRLFTHIGGVQLGYIAATVGGGAQPVAQTGGGFHAPQWNAAGGRLFYATQFGGRQRVVAVDPGGAQHDVLRFEGTVAFAASPDGARLAYQVQHIPATPAPTGRPIAFTQTTSPGFAPSAIDEALVVRDLATGRDVRVTNVPVVAFFWSPDSRRLLFVAVEQGAQGLEARWYVWDAQSASALKLDAFTPSLTYSRDFLPFFDQYARAATPWSPDGSRFVYPGTDASGRDAIWVQPADGSSPPVRVADGVFAAWSP